MHTAARTLGTLIVWVLHLLSLTFLLHKGAAVDPDVDSGASGAQAGFYGSAAALSEPRPEPSLMCCVFVLLMQYRNEDNDMATDNAVAALGRVLAHHAEALGPDGGAAAATLWVQSLPLKADAVEATVRR